jgi:hypothetical protein
MLRGQALWEAQRSHLRETIQNHHSELRWLPRYLLMNSSLQAQQNQNSLSLMG